MGAGQVGEWVFAGASWLLAAGWIWQAVAAAVGMRTLPDLTLRAMGAGLTAGDEGEWELGAGPLVSVIVPACNEEDKIEGTLRSLLATEGVRIEVIAVDDRSTDRTGVRMEAVAAEMAGMGAHTLRVIHIKELPAGWMGKAHAMARAAEMATGRWLLFTDGDVWFGPEALARSVGYGEEAKADHVVLALTLEYRSVAEEAAFAAFQAQSQWSVRLWKVADAGARDFFGAGGFSMVRRAVYEQIGGFAGMRMEVVEDLLLAFKIKRAGYRQRVVVGPGLTRLRWNHGALGMVSLLEKNGFAALRYSVGLALAAFVGLAVEILLPLAAIASGGWTMVAGLLIHVGIAGVIAANRKVNQASAWNAVMFSPATAVFLYALVRSMVLTLRRNGVVWRGTLYPLEELRRNARGSW
ncbi:MAG: glycosyltransferase family 2 protein [Terracidiphilus sp.]